MAVFDIPDAGTPAPEPTRQERAAYWANLIRLRTAGSLESLVLSLNEGRRDFWENREGYTPGEIAEAYGTACGELFASNAAAEAWLTTYHPNAAARLWQPPYDAYDIVPEVTDGQPTGRITVTEKPAPEEPPAE